VPPSAGGVQDYAIKLRSELGSSATKVVAVESGRANLELSESDSVVVQYSGYGYQRRGVPVWLLEAVESYRSRAQAVGIVFHELYAFGPPWRSSFWLSPVQRRIARRLVETSSFWMTNRECSARWLSRFGGSKPHAVLPVFSNVGELRTWRQERKNRIIVFGSPGLRHSTYRAAGDALFAWAKQSSMEVHDIGEEITDSDLRAKLERRGVIQHGRLDEDSISSLMRTASFGVLAYPVAYVAKSGVIASYCAHGLCPILLSDRHTGMDGLVAYGNYLPRLPEPSLRLRADSEHIGRAAWSWYQTHRVAAHAAVLREFTKCGKVL
jgi:hypothetical protein